MRIVPDVWGTGGALFAFSGMDGDTDWFHPVTASTIASGRGLRFHVPGSPILRFGVCADGRLITGGAESPFTSVQDQMVLGSVIRSVVRAGGIAVRLTYVFLSNETVGIEAALEEGSGGGVVFVQCQCECARQETGNGGLLFDAGEESYALVGGSTVDTAKGIAAAELDSSRQTARFAWACSKAGGADALRLARIGLEQDFEKHVSAQASFIDSLPPPNTDSDQVEKAYLKAASVMKLNCWSPRGAIRLPWTTPDRWPHANMWIWDSAFHAIGLRHISTEWAESAIKAVLSVQREDGFIPITATPDPTRAYDLIQPPILAWAALKVFQSSRNLEFLSRVHQRAGRFVEYILSNLDSDGNGLAEWKHSNASGMDNSPRFDRPVKDAIDLNCYLANEMQSLAAISKLIGDESGAARWNASAQVMAGRIENVLWDEQSGFYYDNSPEGSLIRIKTIAGLMPLFAGVCSPQRAERLVRHLANPDEFWRCFPVASVSADEDSFSDNMWRGPVWINCNYMLIEGLRRCGYDGLAGDLREKTIGEVARWYAADGVIYEFYDSEGKTDPAHLHRKQRGGPGAVRGEIALDTSVCDYNWTAALFFDLLREPAELTTRSGLC